MDGFSCHVVPAPCSLMAAGRFWCSASLVDYRGLRFPYLPVRASTTARGIGMCDAVAGKKSEQGRANNRRVELVERRRAQYQATHSDRRKSKRFWRCVAFKAVNRRITAFASDGGYGLLPP